MALRQQRGHTAPFSESEARNPSADKFAHSGVVLAVSRPPVYALTPTALGATLPRDMAKQSYGISEAARLLGISPEALRQRVRRGAVEASKGDNGRWYVLLDDKQTETSTGSELTLREFIEDYRLQLEHTRNEVAAWRQESERKDSIILTLLQRTPAELESPAEEPPRHRSWWRRMFGLR